MRETASAHNLGDAFANANQVSTDGHAFIDNTLSKIVRSNNPAQETITPEAATHNVLNSGDTTLQAVRDRLPAAADAAAAFKLRNMALAAPGQSGATGGETSTGSFLTDLNRMRQRAPGGTAALFGQRPEVAQNVTDLATVAARIRETERQLNTSGTGQYLGWASLLPAVSAGYAGGGMRGAAAATTPYLSAATLAKAMTNPGLARLMATPGSPGLLGGALSNVSTAP
jgi:hypothetical protein